MTNKMIQVKQKMAVEHTHARTHTHTISLPHLQPSYLNGQHGGLLPVRSPVQIQAREITIYSD